jgi:capping protein beta
MLDSKEANLMQLYRKLDSGNKAKNLKCKMIITLVIGTLLEYDQDLNTEFERNTYPALSVCKLDSKGEFIQSEYNREEGSFRSPWTNRYFPDMEYPKYPPKELRILEEQLNELFKKYSELYYGPSAVSSVYIWEQGDSIQKGFNTAMLIKNQVDQVKGLTIGSWESVNLITVNFHTEKDKLVERIKVTYKLTTNICYKLTFDGIDVAGEVTKTVSKYL